MCCLYLANVSLCLLVCCCCFLGERGLGAFWGGLGWGVLEWHHSFFYILFFSQIRELMEDDPEWNKDLLEVRLTAELLGCMNHSTPSLSCVSPLPCWPVCMHVGCENISPAFEPWKYISVRSPKISAYTRLPTLLSGTFLQTLPELIMPLKGLSSPLHSSPMPKNPCKQETHPPRVKKKKKVLSRLRRFWFYLCWRKQRGQLYL